MKKSLIALLVFFVGGCSTVTDSQSDRSTGDTVFDEVLKDALTHITGSTKNMILWRSLETDSVSDFYERDGEFKKITVYKDKNGEIESSRVYEGTFTKISEQGQFYNDDGSVLITEEDLNGYTRLYVYTYTMAKERDLIYWVDIKLPSSDYPDLVKETSDKRYIIYGNAATLYDDKYAVALENLPSSDKF